MYLIVELDSGLVFKKMFNNKDIFFFNFQLIIMFCFQVYNYSFIDNEKVYVYLKKVLKKSKFVDSESD